jgi:pyridoxamine 5'-phosphate oxidase
MSPRSAADEDLAALPDAIWAELARAVNDHSHGWRTPVLATVDGEVADARTVVLREVDVALQALNFFTDARSPKVAQLQRNPLGTVAAWCPRLSWQLRMRVALQIETDGLAVSSLWAKLKLRTAAQDYMSELPPGSLLPARSEPARLEIGTRAHFALLRAKVLQIDWLGLRPQGHRRALVDAHGARWTTP